MKVFLILNCLQTCKIKDKKIFLIYYIKITLIFSFYHTDIFLCFVKMKEYMYYMLIL